MNKPEISFGVARKLESVIAKYEADFLQESSLPCKDVKSGAIGLKPLDTEHNKVGKHKNPYLGK